MILRSVSVLTIVLATATACASTKVSTTPTMCSDLLAGEAQAFDITVQATGARAVPFTVFRPSKSGEYPLIAFSHGAFAAPERYGAMLRPLAASGFVVLAPMHVDSELFDHGDASPPPPDVTWGLRNEDVSLALTVPQSVRAALGEYGVQVDTSRAVAMGHSYGALMAQLAGGAQSVGPDEVADDVSVEGVDAIVAWSPPGPLPGRMEAEGWQKMAAPSLTITGTADILPGFIDDWQLHTVSYANAPEGSATLWVGDGVNHYFGGVFGRESEVSAQSRLMFDRAMAQTLAFIEAQLDMPSPCMPGAAIPGERLDVR